MLRIKILVLALFAAFTAALLLTDNVANPRARAYSAGPPAGFTHAPGELDCSDCHTTPAQSGGTLVLGVPDKYTPGQTYDITVTHASTDATRVRWGFQMTALDAADQKAGAFAPADDHTRVINGEGPFPAREYVEHTSAGTFPGQLNGAAWAFKWTAPAQDVGPVTFYLAGNQANGDGNSSGDNIYFTFKSATYQAPAPDFRVSVSPALRNVVQGSNATYDVNVEPLNGFTGTVTLTASGLPTGATANFQPASVNLSNTSPQTSVLTVSTTNSTTTGTSVFNINAASGALAHTTQAGLGVAGGGDADLSVTQSVSPNPAQTNAEIRYTINVFNHGPAAANSARLLVTMPGGFSFFVPGAGGEGCALTPGATNAAYDCSLGALPAGQGTTVDFTVRTPAVGLFNTTTTLSANDFLMLEKATGRVVRVKNGVAQGVVLDLSVNSASERGLLGLALHPNFATNRFVYLYWTESTTGQDTSAVEATPLLGNRVDRYVMNGSTLTFDRNLLRLRALQTDAGQPARGNHNGGVLRFGPDGKLYVFVGDEGRRGFFQNLPCGPTVTCPETGPPLVPDDQFGGPEPDDAHATGAILRLNDDGTTPNDNPYAQIPTVQTGPVVENVRRLYAYGVRNGFGMDFDPVGGHLWTQENGDDAFDEINRVEAGFNGGWAQLMGPSSRVGEFKAIEVARGNSLQQNRWPPSNLADTPAEALARLYKLPGSKYTEPEFSWKYAVAPSPVGFARGAGLGAQYAGDLFVGASRTTLLGGYLMRFELSADRKTLAATDSRLADKVADNADKFDLAESESLVVGRDFGVTTDIQTEPSKGNLYVVSLSNGAVYEVYGRPTLFAAALHGGLETPANGSGAFAEATLLLDRDGQTALVSLRFFSGLSTPQTAAHLHAPAPPGQTAPPVFDLPNGNFTDFQVTLTPQQVRDLHAGLFYVNVHSTAFPAGEIRGQFGPLDVSNIVQFETAGPSVNEAAGFKTIKVERIGDTTVAAAVGYKTSGGTASERSDYTTASGVLRFAPGETVKSFDVLVTDDGLKEPDETIGLLLEAVPGGDAGVEPTKALKIIDNDAADSASNPIDSSDFFVRQHYHDFLNREPDAPGFQFWTNEIERCGADAQCREVKRINVSAAFFLSIEFQRTGLLAYLANRAAFGNATTEPQVPVRYADFERDVQALQHGYAFGQPGVEAVLEANRRAYFDEFVARPEFVSKYGAMTNSQFVSALLASNNLAASVGNIHVARLDAAQQVPPGASPASGAVVLRRPFTGGSRDATVSLYLSNLSSPVTAVHIHGPAAPGAEAPAIINLPAGEFTDFQITFTQEQTSHSSKGGSTSTYTRRTTPTAKS